MAMAMAMVFLVYLEIKKPNYESPLKNYGIVQY
jgi:hypothetical protein